MNKQITEDFVSFEIAKLLKEKGFDIPCRQAYFNGSLVDYTMYGFCDGELLDCPSQSLALKWLREEHLYHIFTKPVQLKNRVDWRARIVAEDCDTLPITIHGESPEQAIEEALLYVLKNLI